MRRALLRIFADNADIATDGRKLLWEKQSYKTMQSGGHDCHIHRAVVVHLREFSGRLHLLLKPTVVILDTHGNELPRDMAKVVTLFLRKERAFLLFGAKGKDFYSVI